MQEIEIFLSLVFFLGNQFCKIVGVFASEKQQAEMNKNKVLCE
jgi:hypothetical protein